jgi:hypothetical protein
VGDGLHSAIITATKPAAADPAATATAPANRTHTADGVRLRLLLANHGQ